MSLIYTDFRILTFYTEKRILIAEVTHDPSIQNS
jgi:hypothetical protein